MMFEGFAYEAMNIIRYCVAGQNPFFISYVLLYLFPRHFLYVIFFSEDLFCQVRDPQFYSSAMNISLSD